MNYEYIRLPFDFGDLHQMNRLSKTGWRVVAVERETQYGFSHMALMERELPEENAESLERLKFQKEALRRFVKERNEHYRLKEEQERSRSRFDEIPMRLQQDPLKIEEEDNTPCQ